MWDTYLAEALGDGEAPLLTLHVYVCAALLVHFSDELLASGFPDTLLLLQSLPTRDWTNQQIEELLSRAFILKTQYSQSRAHLES